jgi:hypothetical protein
MTKKNLCLFLFLSLVAVAWSAVLAYQAYSVADPAVVSAPQVYLSSVVVAAEVAPVQNGLVRARILKIYKDDLQPFRQLPIEIKIVWPASAPQPDRPTAFLLALRAAGGQAGDLFEVAPIPTPGRLLDPQVYFITDSVRLQAERILKK